MIKLYSSATVSAFEKRYDRHSATMYGCIIKIIPDKQHAEKVLRNAFIDLPLQIATSGMPVTDPIFFIRYAMQKSLPYLKLVKLPYEDCLSVILKEIRNTKKPHRPRS